MAPKKKGGKKAQDDWEAEAAEDPVAQAEREAKEDEDDGEAKESQLGGGLLATIKKNRGKKAKKGKPIDDFVEGEDPTIDGADATPETDLSAKAPKEATFDDDEEDIYSGPIKKANNAKGAKSDKVEEPKDDDEERDASGRVMTKKEKEKAKKEREKQRKKEQVCRTITRCLILLTNLCDSRPQRKRPQLQHQQPRNRNQPKRLQKLKKHQRLNQYPPRL